jgi:RNA polymerase sigma-70 factor (ECF subfamily)
MKMNESAALNKIIDGCKKGKNEDFNRLIDLYSNRLYAFFYRMSSDKTTSNDLLSEMFVKLVEKISGFKGGSFDGWLFTIAANLFRDHLRKSYREKKLLEQKAIQMKTLQEEKSMQPEVIDDLSRAMAKIEPDTAELLTLRYQAGLSFKQLAEMRKEPIGTTLSKVHRAIKELRDIMAAENELK